MPIYSKHYFYQKGISLIELVIFIVILSVALTGITLIYINTTRYSADPMVRIRSIELAQSTLEEILLKAFDHNTPVGGGCVRFATNSKCSATAFPSNPDALVTVLTPAVTTSAEEVSRSTYNDVDDYHNKLYCGAGVLNTTTACPTLPCEAMKNATTTSNDITDEYAGYSVCIQVSFAGGTKASGAEISNVSPITGINDVLDNDAKRIDVIVTDPLNSRIGLSAYRLNY